MHIGLLVLNRPDHIEFIECSYEYKNHEAILEYIDQKGLHTNKMKDRGYFRGNHINAPVTIRGWVMASFKSIFGAGW